jgi:hypothetical protein
MMININAKRHAARRPNGLRFASFTDSPGVHGNFSSNAERESFALDDWPFALSRPKAVSDFYIFDELVLNMMLKDFVTLSPQG